MTDAEMLKRMRLTARQLRSLLQKTNHYYRSLTPAQRAVVMEHLPKVEAAAATLGKEVTAEQLEAFLETYGKVNPLALHWCRCCIPYDDDDSYEA